MVQRIDEKLLRRRAEHNEGELSTLREVTLHQFDIERIENLDVYCRNLEILYLQGNQISKIENLHKLKRLEYLQLALNNIKKIENLKNCESLKKLDLTVNFIDNPLCVESLRNNIHLQELYLVGNPCTQVQGYRKFVVATLPQLKSLDGKEIEKSERIQAMQEYKIIRESLLKLQSEASKTKNDLVADNASDPSASEKQETKKIEEEDDIAQRRTEFQTKPVPHTPEARLAAARDLALMRENKSIDGSTLSDPLNKKKERILFASDGRILQKNEGSHHFKWEVTPSTITLTVEISKFLDTSLIDVDVHPTWLRVTIKDKILQLVIEEEVFTDNVVCERSRLTGQLSITMLKLSHGCTKEAGVIEIRRHDRSVMQAKHNQLATAKAAEPQKESGTRNRRLERLGIDYRNIVRDSSVSKTNIVQSGLGQPAAKIVDMPIIAADLNTEEELEDDGSVPPLC